MLSQLLAPLFTLAFQGVTLEVTVTAVLLARQSGLNVLMDTVNVGWGCGACVTVMVLVGAPDAVTVIVPVLLVAFVLAVALILKLPSPVRLAGVRFAILNQLALLLIVHWTFDVTLMVVLSDVVAGLHVLLDNVKIGCGSCLTTIVRTGAPGAVTLILPVLVLAVVLAVALILKLPSPVRLVGVALEMVNQLTLLVTVHLAFEVTLMVVLLGTCLGFQASLDKVSLDWKDCVTLMVRVGAPGAVTVMMPSLFRFPVLAVVLILKLPSPVRFAGVALEIVNQLTLLVTVHLAFDLTLMVVLSAICPGFQVLLDTVNVRLGCWVTVILRVGAPGAVTVMVPVRGKLPVWRVVVSLKEPLPMRSAGVVLEILSQFALLVTLHLAFSFPPCFVCSSRVFTL